MESEHSGDEQPKTGDGAALPAAPGSAQDRVVLCGIGYRVTVHDGQVIFEEDRGAWGTFGRFAFEKRSNALWYFVHLETDSGRVVASHIVEAYQYCRKHYGDDFVDLPNVEDSQEGWPRTSGNDED